jgi:POT family proton-dependent oligopeptide transporter
MDRNFLGFEWLPSQLQSLNSVFVLLLIPIFSYVVYPWFEKFRPLTPMRKMGIGFVLMTAAFVLVSVIQVWIDGGARPNIAWQIAAYALLTASEIMISIVALEFAYTQAPRKMKSFIMCFYLVAVALGNFLVVVVNHCIQVPSAAEQQMEEAIARLPADWQKDPRTVVLPGYDGETGTKDDFIRRLEKDAETPLVVPGQAMLNTIAEEVISHATASGNVFPDPKTGHAMVSKYKDDSGKPYRYAILNSNTVRIWGAGSDGKWNTKWDVGVIISKPDKEKNKKASWLDRLHPEEDWLSKRHRQLQLTTSQAKGSDEPYTQTTFSGGQSKLQGAGYFWFFSALMGGTALLFIPFAMIYRPKHYLQDETPGDRDS